MGYFSNGSEGMSYQETYCGICRNYIKRKGEMTEGCPVWDLHLEFSYKLCSSKENEGKRMLDYLIPIDTKTCNNEECRMYLPIGAKGQVRL